MSSSDVTGDESTPLASWADYELAVKADPALAPEISTTIVKANEKFSFSVDDALDSIDLTFNGYMPSEDALKFFNIVRIVLGEDPEVSNGLMHYFLVDLIFGNIKRENYPYSEEIRKNIRLNPRKIAIIASRFSAKALALDSEVYTPSGVTDIASVEVGDKVLDRDGRSCNVISKSGVFYKDTYKLTLADGRELTVSSDHDNIVWKRVRKYKGKFPSHTISSVAGTYGYGMTEEVITAEDMYRRGVTTKRTPIKEGFNDKEYKFYVPLVVPNTKFDYVKVAFDMDPYTVGVILGDGYVGSTGQPRLTYHTDDGNHYKNNIPYEFGKEIRKTLPDGTQLDCYSTCLLGVADITLKHIGVKTSYHKRVPAELLNGSYKQRLEVLKGLMDTDGTVYKNGYCSFTSTSEGLAEDVQHLIRTTGGSAFTSLCSTPSLFGKAWRVNIKTNTIIFKLPRKVCRQRFKVTATRVGVVSIKKVGTVPTRCIAVDSPTKSFLTNGFTITHNSTIITAFMPIYVAITGKIPNFGNVMFWVSFGDSQQAGAKVQANTVRDICEDSVFCKDYFERMRFTDEECEFVRKGTGPEKKRSFMFKVKGAAGGSVRGIRYKTERPQIFTFDDIIKNESEANSLVIMNKLRSMIYSDADNALGRKGKIIIVNTPFNKKDPVYNALESGVWTPVCIPICEKIYMGMKEEDYIGSWQAMKSFKDVMEKYDDAYHGDTIREFNQELMLRISSPEDRLVKDDQIQWYSRKSLEKNLPMYNIYITTDLTASNSLKGDFSVVFGWAISSNNDWFMLDLSVKKMTIDDQYKPIFQMNRDWGSKYGRNVTVGIEIDGQQQLNMHVLKKQMIEYNSFFTFARQIGSPAGKEGISRRQASGAKHEQFMRVHPLFQQHKMYFPEELKDTPDMQELLNELQYITYDSVGSKHDDALDGISMIAAMDIMLPAAIDTNTYSTITADGLVWESIWDDDTDDEIDVGSTVF